MGKRIFTVGCTPQNTLFKNRKGGKKKLIKLHNKDYYFNSMRPELFLSSKSHSNIRNLSSALLVVKERENKKISIFQEDSARESQGKRSLSLLPTLHTEINDSLRQQREAGG